MKLIRDNCDPELTLIKDMPCGTFFFGKNHPQLLFVKLDGKNEVACLNSISNNLTIKWYNSDAGAGYPISITELKYAYKR